MDANCSNTKGSFYCTCHMGYSGDGVVCLGRSFLSRFGPPFTNFANYLYFLIIATIFLYQDINECDPSGLSSEHQDLAHICHDDANCTNTKGSYHCTCLNGYTGLGEYCTGTVLVIIFKNDMCLNPLNPKEPYTATYWSCSLYHL